MAVKVFMQNSDVFPLADDIAMVFIPIKQQIGCLLRISFPFFFTFLFRSSFPFALPFPFFSRLSPCLFLAYALLVVFCTQFNERLPFGVVISSSDFLGTSLRSLDSKNTNSGNNGSLLRVAPIGSASFNDEEIAN